MPILRFLILFSSLIALLCVEQIRAGQYRSCCEDAIKDEFFLAVEC